MEYGAKFHRPKLSNADMEIRLREAGLSATLQRIEIGRYILSEADHPTADEVFRWAEGRLAKISLATVYNTLHSLAEAGLIREVRFPHLEKVIYDSNTSDHFHFYDSQSEKIFDLPAEIINIESDFFKGIEIEKMDLFIKGQRKSKTTKKQHT